MRHDDGLGWAALWFVLGIAFGAIAGVFGLYIWLFANSSCT